MKTLMQRPVGIHIAQSNLLVNYTVMLVLPLSSIVVVEYFSTSKAFRRKFVPTALLPRDLVKQCAPRKTYFPTFVAKNTPLFDNAG